MYDYDNDDDDNYVDANIGPVTKLSEIFSKTDLEIWKMIREKEPRITPEQIRQILIKDKLLVNDPQKQYLNYYIYYIVQNINDFGNDIKMIKDNDYKFLLNSARFWDDSYGSYRNLNDRENFLKKSIELYKNFNEKKHLKIKYSTTTNQEKYNYSDTIKKKCGLADNQILVSTTIDKDGNEIQYDVPYYDVTEIQEGRCESSNYLKRISFLDHNVFDDPDTHELYPISLFLPSIAGFEIPNNEIININLSNRQFNHNFNKINDNTQLLNLDNNNLSVVPNLNSSNLTNLQYLSIRGNNIGVNGLSTLQNLPVSLTNLDLSGNRISSVELSTKIPQNLKSLNLSDNLISTLFLIKSHSRIETDIENDIILPPILSCLYLDNNFIQNLNDIKFPNLLILSLEGNIITASGLFGVIFPETLKYLNLNYNRLNDLRKYPIEKNEDNEKDLLNYLNLITSNPVKIHNFINFPKDLEFLSIDGNELTDDDLNRLKLNSLMKLKYLSLQYNQITGDEIIKTSHILSKSLQILGLGNNPNLKTISKLIPPINFFQRLSPNFLKYKNDGNLKSLYLNDTELKVEEINTLVGYNLNFLNINNSNVSYHTDINNTVTKSYYLSNETYTT